MGKGQRVRLVLSGSITSEVRNARAAQMWPCTPTWKKASQLTSFRTRFFSIGYRKLPTASPPLDRSVSVGSSALTSPIELLVAASVRAAKFCPYAQSAWKRSAVSLARNPLPCSSLRAFPPHRLPAAPSPTPGTCTFGCLWCAALTRRAGRRAAAARRRRRRPRPRRPSRPTLRLTYPCPDA